MNYLAHLFLAENTPKSRLGNFLGDFVKGKLERSYDLYNREIIKGISTHRQVDCFTDRHEIYLQSKRRIIADQGRFSGISIDIFYDHFLAKNWLSFSQEKLESFADNFYKILNRNQDLLPHKLKNFFPKMVAENWLVSYRTIEGIRVTCGRLAKRIKRKNRLLTAHKELQQNYSELESDFLTFFPQLIGYVETNRHIF